MKAKAFPGGRVVQGSDGNFYGTLFGGDYGSGTVFEVTPQGTFTVLNTFDDSALATFPATTVIRGLDGNVYGTTEGELYEIAPGGAFTFLSDAGGSLEGIGPATALVPGLDGNF